MGISTLGIPSGPTILDSRIIEKKGQVFKEIFKSTKIMFQTCNSYKNKLISFHIYPNYMFVPMDSKDQSESTGGGGVARKSWCTNKSEGHKVH